MGKAQKSKAKFYRINMGITKCYLLKCREGYLLVDTAYKGGCGKFLRKLKGLGIDQSRIKYILLTHHHDDHAGFAAELRELTGAKLIVHRDALANLRNGESEDNMQPVNGRVKAVFSLFRAFHRNFRYTPVLTDSGDIVLTGDDDRVLRELGIEGTILHTPGHTADSISIVLKDGSALVGDAVMNFLKPCGTKHRPIYIESSEEVFKSWGKLLQKGAKKIYPSHGKPFEAKRLGKLRKKFTGKDGELKNAM